MSQDRQPVPDRAEDDAFFPSPFSLTQYVAPKTDFDGTKYPKPYTGKQKILVIGTQERYLDMNGKYFSTGNHPVETLLPMHHLHDAGFESDIATVGGDSVKLEMWAFPTEDETVKKVYEHYKPNFKKPLNLADIVDKAVSKDSPYAAVFIPGGHGCLNGIPFDKNVARILEEFTAQNKFIITLCHGPAALLAPANVDGTKAFPFKGYEITCFPDSLDEGANIEIGYIPNKMNWLVGDKLEALGVKIVNSQITGEVKKDRHLLTGDSPLAANNLGKLSANTLLEAFAK